MQLFLPLPAPAEPTNLQLSFMVAAAGQVCAAACICSFYGNPFAFANVPLLPAATVAAATCRYSCRCCRQPQQHAAAARAAPFLKK
ncbi:hypothetical protein [Methanimicrococcus hongohii]|uniref:hypothetical protein n=1 Tax=Methanimicrococcus hongohii TaxID=3028295 RepID=UPI00292D0EB6|nr:hypothetical protein [Methanimicrococcus sp. Hf6]